MKNRRTKIIATLGPSCSDISIIQDLANKGVNCFRVNLSHGTMEQKINFFKLIKTIKTEEQNRPAILADLAGPKIRVFGLDKPIILNNGDKVLVSNEKVGEKIIPVSKNVSFQDVQKSAKIKIDDGRIVLEVVKHISKNTLECCVVVSGKIEDRKGVNFPGISLNVPCLTDEDVIDLKLALENGADWIALSFTRKAEDYDLVESKIKEFGYKTPIMAKIEKWEAIDNLGEIIRKFDAVMVARGDLGVELPIEQVPLIQKKVTEKANQLGKPVIIATQILESMTKNQIPTRAEISDIANAIFDGADALMVTGETAIGNFPQYVVKVLSKAIIETESDIAYKNYYLSKSQNLLSTSQAISHAACSVAHDLNIKNLVTMTHSGSTAIMTARYRPIPRIIALTPFEYICRRLSIVWGVVAFKIDGFSKADEIPDTVKNVLKDKEFISNGEKIVITGGVPVGVPGTTNYLSVMKLD